MEKFTLTLKDTNKSNNFKVERNLRKLEVENKNIKEVLPTNSFSNKESKNKDSKGRAKGPMKKDINLKKVDVIRSYCTKSDKLLFAEYCKKNNISESAYLEKYVLKAIKTLKKKGK